MGFMGGVTILFHGLNACETDDDKSFMKNLYESYYPLKECNIIKDQE